MFTFIFLILLFAGGFLLYKGLSEKNSGRIITGALVAFLAVFLLWFPDFWTEKLWFDAISYNQRFWSLFFFKNGLMIVGALVALGIVAGLLWMLPGRRFLRLSAYAVAALIGGSWGAANWELVLQYWHRVETGLADPILGRDTGFYLFSLPFLDALYSVLVTLAVLSLVIAAISKYILVPEGNQFRLEVVDRIDEQRINRAVYINAGILFLIAAAGKYLDRFHLLYSDLGAVSGPGWTDVNIILPSLLGVSILTALLGILFFIPGGRNFFRPLLARLGIRKENWPVGTVGLTSVSLLLIWFVVLSVIPGAFQSFTVEPNEVSYEEPFIRNNIEFTRHGFNLQTAENKEFPAAEIFSRELVARNRDIFNNIRLWDWRALDAVLKQFQEIRLYYEFNDVDVDRYYFDGEYKQVMVSAREMKSDNLPPNSQTFVNKTFKYTHGYGIALTTVSEFTPEGLPNLLVKNIPPESKYPELAVTQPQIYYGELTDDYVVTNSTEQEFDYPQGEGNEYIRYSGTGGVQLSNIWRKILFADKMGDIKLLLSAYPTAESRLMFRRQVGERVKTLAPFLEFSDDPYIVNANGQLYWMIDAFTTSTYFPYSKPFSSRELIEFKEGEQNRRLEVQHDRDFEGVNYIRNSVKAVVNAFNGNVEFYIFDKTDPLIRVWDGIFPGLFKQREEMPQALEAHIRYPTDYLLMQGLVYAKYHMGDPEVFYNQEDLWIRATENYYGEVQPVEPYYIMWQQPGADSAEFSLILPFTPKNRQVAIGWIAGLCDGDNYGRFLAYSFPKDKRVLGPQQVETKIDQNSFLSGQLSLWDQRGSSVIRGNVLAIPIENTLFYVEPIYLQAETAAYPELRLVCVMHDDKLSYAETFEEALEGLFGEGDAPLAPARAEGRVDSTAEMIRTAKRALDDYLQATGQGRFEAAADALDQLQNTLENLTGRGSEVLPDSTGLEIDR